eukprot:916304-Karenia_brevis.AAC.1
MVTAGGILALVREPGRVEVIDYECPFDGFIWLMLFGKDGIRLHTGGAYIPGASDPRFRRCQGDGKTDHFDALIEHLGKRIGSPW